MIERLGLICLVLALGAAFFGLGRTPEERLHIERLAAITAALSVLWTRPVRLPRIRSAGLVCMGFGVLWFVLASSDVMWAEVRSAAFTHWQRSVTGLLLFYVAFVLARRGLGGLLLTLALGHLLFLLPSLVFGLRLWNEPPLWFLALWMVFVPGSGLLLSAMTSSGRVRLSGMEHAWRTAALFLLLLAVIFAGARLRFRAWSLESTSWPAFDPRQTAAPALAARTLALHPMRGVGAGSLVERLESRGIHPFGDRSLRRTPMASPRPQVLDDLPEEAVWSVLEPEDPGGVRWRKGLDPRLLNAWRLLLPERGLLVTGLAVAAVLFVALHLAGAVALAPRARAAFYGFALLVLWVGVLLEGFLSLSPSHPYGVLLCWVLAGAAWGAGLRLRHGLRRESGLLAKFVNAPRPVSATARGESLLERPDWLFLGVTLAVAALLGLHTARAPRSESLATRLEGQLEENRTNLARWQSLAARHPLSARFHLGLGRALALESAYAPQDDGLAHRAERALRQAIACNPCRPEPYAALCAFHEQRGGHEAARGVLQQGLGECPQSLLLTLWRAQVARAADDATEFAAAWREAVRLASGPQYAPSVRVHLMRYLAQDYERRGLPRRALTAHYALLQISPDDKASLQAIHRLATFATAIP